MLINAKIDLTKVAKEHVFIGKKGKYLDLQIWVNDEEDQYGNNVAVKQSYKVGDSFESHYIGNGKKYEKGGGQQPQQQQREEPDDLLY
jgi:hypothetical protein